MIRAMALALCWGQAALACDAALVLAMDVSGSVDAAEYRLQVDGLADALEDAALREVMERGAVAVMVTQWSGLGQQAISLGWQQMRAPGDAAALAHAVRALPRGFSGGETAVGQALAHALAQFAHAPACARRIVDLSGDGAENVGFDAGAARRAAMAAGVEVNALAIEAMGLSISNFYARWVVTPGGFVETARGHMDYPRAIKAKMLRELTKPAS